jgi:hypothetical protein
MASTENRDLLRHLEMIARAKPSTESTLRAMDKTRQALLTNQGVSAPTKTIRLFGNPVVKIAVAAILLLTIALTVALWNPGRSVPPVNSKDTASAYKVELQRQTERINTLFAARDVTSMLAMMDDAQTFKESRVSLANQLKDIGDERAIPVLQRYAGQWSQATANPYLGAIDVINTRIQATATQPATTTVEHPISPALVQLQQANQQAKGVLCGLITDGETGDPIGDVQITIQGDSEYLVSTDTKGFYWIDHIEQDGRYHIRLACPGYLTNDALKELPLVALTGNESRIEHFTMRRGCLIDIHTVDESGQPVPDVHLTAHWLGEERAMPLGQAAPTNEAGQSTLFTLEPSETPYMITALHNDFAPQHVKVVCSDPDSLASKQLILHAGQRIQGYAEFSDGVPAQGFYIQLEPQWLQGNQGVVLERDLVDAKGDFSLSHITPGSYAVKVSVVGKNGNITSSVVATRDLPLGEGDLLRVTLPQRSPGSLRSIQGTIQWVGSSRPDKVILIAVQSIDDKNIFVRTELTEENLNAFTIDGLEPGPFTLLCHGRNVKEALLHLGATQQDLTIPLEYSEQPIITGRVVRSDTGHPIKNYTISVKRQVNLPGFNYNNNDLPHIFVERDTFEFASNGPGTYVLAISAEGYVTQDIPYEAHTDARSLLIEMHQGGTIQGTLVDAAGLALPGGTVTLVPTRASQMAKVTKAPEGAFRLSAVPEGNHTLKITHPDYGVLTVPARDVIEGITTDLGSIALYHGGAIEGRILDHRGIPVTDAMVIVDDGLINHGTEGQLAATVTDIEGYYKIQGLPSELCYVSLRNADKRTGVVRRSVIPTDHVTTQVDFGSGPAVFGQLTDNGLPRANARLLLTHPDNPSSKAFQCFTQSDASGHFQFRGIPVGRYGIYWRERLDTDWKKAATLEMNHEAETREIDLNDLKLLELDYDVDLGEIPKSQHTIEVTLLGHEYTTIADWKVFIQKGDRLWGYREEGEPSSQPGGPFMIRNMPIGNYHVVAERADGFKTVRQRIEVLPQHNPVRVTLQLVAGQASVHGRLTHATEHPLILFNREQTLIARLINDKGRYQVANLPAGEYYIGNAFLTDTAPLAEFSLGAGETLSLDLNVSAWITTGQGLLSVEVLSQDGLPLPAATAWLDGMNGEIESLFRIPSEILFVAPVGEYRLHVSHRGFKEQSQAVTITPNDILALHPQRPVVRMRLESQYTPF